MNVTDTQRAASASTLMVAGLAANVGFYLLSMLVNAVVPGAYDSPWQHVETIAWLGLDVLLAVALFQLAAAVEQGGLLRLAAVVLLFSIVIDLPLYFLRGEGSFQLSQLLSVLSLLFLLFIRGALSAAFVQLTKNTHPWVLPLLGVVVVLTVVRVGLSAALSFGAVSTDLFVSPLYRYGMPFISLVNAGGTLVAGFAVRSAVSGARQTQSVLATAGLVPQPPEPLNPMADFLVGGILLAVGIGVTAISFSSASGGGKYVVATGAIGVGIGRIIRGVIRMAKA
jgi:hypothetical protein